VNGSLDKDIIAMLRHGFFYFKEICLAHIKIVMRFCLTFFICMVMMPVFAQTERDDRQAIERTVQLYFDGMMDRNLSKLQEAFHPEARLIGYRGDNFTVTSFSDWSTATSKGDKRDKSKFENNLLDVEVKGNTALAKTELFWPGIYYYDFLTLIKIDGEWKIVHKTWYEEKR